MPDQENEQFDDSDSVKYLMDLSKNFKVPKRKIEDEKQAERMLNQIYQKKISMGEKDNISAIYHQHHDKPSTKRFHPIAFLRNLNILKKRLITKQIKQEFGIG